MKNRRHFYSGVHLIEINIVLFNFFLEFWIASSFAIVHEFFFLKRNNHSWNCFSYYVDWKRALSVFCEMLVSEVTMTTSQRLNVASIKFWRQLRFGRRTIALTSRFFKAKTFETIEWALNTASWGYFLLRLMITLASKVSHLREKAHL